MTHVLTKFTPFAAALTLVAIGTAKADPFTFQPGAIVISTVQNVAPGAPNSGPGYRLADHAAGIFSRRGRNVGHRSRLARLPQTQSGANPPSPANMDRPPKASCSNPSTAST